MAFRADYREWRTLSAFEAYLQTIRPFRGARAVALHHTYRPVESQWRGLAHVREIAGWYARTYGWDWGPHFFLTSTGIYQMTPPTIPGIHANQANRSAVGVEHVADGDAAPLPQLLQMSYGVTAALLRWMDIEAVTLATVFAHREVPGVTKSCFGRRMDAAAYRQGLRSYIAQQTAALPTRVTDRLPLSPPRRLQIVGPYGANVRQDHVLDAPVALQLPRGATFLADVLQPGDVWRSSNAWLHVLEVNVNGRTFHEPGFVHALLAEAVVG